MNLWQKLALTWCLLMSWAGVQAAEARFNRPIHDEIFYFVVMDRFNDGDPANNKGLDRIAVDAKDSKDDILRHGYQPELETFYHGGDFKGITQKLDYLQGLGVTAIWLSPILKNRATQTGDGPLGASSGYHGYWPLDFTTVDPHWGTEEDFRNLVDAAHQRGMKLFVDVITNHTADVISYRECWDCPYRSREDYPYVTTKHGKKLNEGFVPGDTSAENFAKLKDPNYAYSPYIHDPRIKKKPDWLNDITLYHNRGNSTFSGESSEMGDFFGLDDLMTENPKVVQGMIAIHADFIKKYKVDGFRIDTVKHVNIEFWEEFIPAMRKAAQEAGVPHFYMFGEVFSNEPALLSRYTRLGKFDSVLDFGLQAAVKDVFADEHAIERLHEYLAQDDVHRLASAPQKMMNFISNHDIGRLAYFMKEHFKDASDAEILKRLTLANAFMYFARGVPIIYYGDEQGFVGKGGDRWAREDMFVSKVKSYREIKPVGVPHDPDKDSFNVNHPLYKTLAGLAHIYQSHPLLRTGEYFPVRDFGPDVLAFRRTLFESNDEYLLVFNMKEAAIQLPWTRTGYGLVHPAGKLGKELSLPPLSFAILKGAKSREKTRVALAPKFSNLEEGQRVADLFHGDVTLPEGEYKVTFSMKSDKDKSFKPLYTDVNAPFRAYVEGRQFPNGTSLILRADVVARNGARANVQRKLIVDAREPLVTVHYENGNNRSRVYTLSHRGTIAVPQNLDKGQFTFAWPLQEAKETLIFEGRSDPEDEDSIAFDRPILLSFKDQISPHIKAGPQGEPVVTVYINNRHEVSFDAMKPAPETKPLALPNNLKAKAPLDKDLYVRGSMNSWSPEHELEYAGNYTYRTKIKLGSGGTEFKFADEGWSTDANFGAPVEEQGLTSSGGSSNLTFEVPKGEAGKYVFDLIYIPAEVLSSDKPLTFFRVEKAR
ncbi:alpha-amylase family glycosyl hydrolase [Oligoflexus tunisiensis]|uniref:alpha-amylase family glycosyl hydrolase n=1 Tax=Oligoflexus tunisiensis TaxID=708132 RepID=UPI000A97736A|nr:alpha-amylase family glycosyl hydrolase [Oligoflexus tunisiensis]